MQYLIRKAPLRQPFEKMRVNPRREKKLTAGMLKSVLPCTLFNEFF